MTDILDRMPYARFLGLQTLISGDEITVTMPFQDRLIGNPMLPALHGGSTAALLEMTAMAQVALIFPAQRLPRPINVTVAYLRTGRPVDVFARAKISRAGRRVAHVQAEAWQEERSQPIASLTAHFLLDNQN
ncbi:MAG: PaaI family thioesterase [Brevundimonas sp.]|uniref:PaaI family thioesterase n=1 Tax=Brevundimonas sp. TaxID=1871086 RepID=UPI0028D206DF|nr:PaaI family thioesterase [uncultured Brevundimonas sp.]